MNQLMRTVNGRVICYTDGACFNNGSNNAAAGYGVVFGINHPWNDHGPVKGRATNNVAEIEAATRAIEIAASHGIQQLLIRTDSQFLIDSCINYMPTWRQNGWRLANGGPVQNAVEFQALDAAIRSNHMSIQLEHVSAHSDDANNAEADRLAKMGAREYQQRRGY